MKKLITLLSSFTILSLPTISLISCDNLQTKGKNSSQLLNNTSKTQTKTSNDTVEINNEEINRTSIEKDNLKTNDNNPQNKENNVSIKTLNNETGEFDAFKNPKKDFNNNEINNERNDDKNNEVDTSNNYKTINNKNSTSNQIIDDSNNNTDNNEKNSFNLDQKNIKAKTWVEKLNEQDPQYLKLINFIEMVSNSTKQLLVDETYNRLPKYNQLIQIKFWDFFWKSFKTEILKASSTDKKLYNEIFNDAILQTVNANTNECTYILKSNNFISFTFGYDKRNYNFYFVSQHPKYGKIDSETDNNIFKKKYEPVYCTITSEDNVELF